MDIKAINSFSEYLRISKVEETERIDSNQWVKPEFKPSPETTALVSAVGQEALKDLNQSKESVFVKLGSLHKLSEGLHKYNKKVWKHKSFFKKIAWYLGLADKSEYQAHKLEKAALSQARLYDKLVKSKTYIHDQNSKPTEEARINLALFNHAVLDSSEFSLIGPNNYERALDGLPFKAAAPWMKEHLKAYKKELIEKRSAKADDSKIKELDYLIQRMAREEVMNESRLKIEEFEKIIEFCENYLQLFNKHKDKIPKEKLEEIESKLISAKKGMNHLQTSRHSHLKSFLSKLKVGKEFTLLGGYKKSKTSESGHAVRYVFYRESEDKVRFTLINTGEGSNPREETFLENLKSLKKQTQLGYITPQRFITHDLVWEHIPIEKLDEDFSNSLFSSYYKSDPSNMKEIIQRIDEKLMDETSAVIKKKGREHKIQRRGSCLVKSLTSYVHERMEGVDPEFYRDFKVFYTEREVKKLPKLLEDYGVAERHHQGFQKAADDILRKRKSKKITS